MYVQDKFEFSEGNKSLSWGGGGEVGGCYRYFLKWTIDYNRSVAGWVTQPVMYYVI